MSDQDIVAGEPVKIRRTLQMDPRTRVEKDRTKYDRDHRKKWKQDLRRYESSDRESIIASRILQYPHRTQSFTYDCGTTATLTVLNYYGFDLDHGVNEQTVMDAIGTDLEGTSNEGIEAGLKKFNLAFENVHTLEDIDRQLELGRPVIVCGDTYPRDWHYMTLIGNENGYYIVSDPWSMPIVRVKREIFDKVWVESDGSRWGVGVIGEPKYKSDLTDMDVKLARRGKTAGLLERIDLTALPELWYENEAGDKWIPEGSSIWPGAPEGFIYQHSMFPDVLHHEVLRVKADNTSEKVMDMEGSWSEDLVLGLVRKGMTLSEAILVAGTACEKCLNVLAHECGLDRGYAEGSEEAIRSHTECEFCK